MEGMEWENISKSNNLPIHGITGVAAVAIKDNISKPKPTKCNLKLCMLYCSLPIYSTWYIDQYTTINLPKRHIFYFYFNIILNKKYYQY